MLRIGQNIKLYKRPSVRPASVDKIVTLLMDRSSLISVVRTSR